MQNYKNKSFTNRIKARIHLLQGAVLLMLMYMIVIGEMGLGDSRIMTPLAASISRLIFFGGLTYILISIFRSKKLLSNKSLLLEHQKESLDERQRFLHDKSGGIVVDILLLVLLFTTCTTALWNMPLFYLSFGLLSLTLLLKLVSYVLYDKFY